MRFLNEVVEHLLGNFKIRDNTVLHRLNCYDVAGRPSEHLFGILTDGFDPPCCLIDRYNRGLVHDDALRPRIDARVSGAQVNGQVIREQR